MATDLKSLLKREWQRRPWWLNVVLLFCLFMTFVYSPFDVLFKPLAEDEDVWFGLVFEGWTAKLGGAVHWLVYGAIALGIWRMAPWGWWLASLYATQVAIAMLLWPILNAPQGGLQGGVIAGALFAIPAVALWRSKRWFRGGESYSEFAN